jgi:UDP-GlcNAc:undecaprenyl-phosphate/decaprenyl-phosphate GlcNAc-1-phosphate transferase
MPNVTGDRVVWAVVACGAIVVVAEPPTVAPAAGAGDTGLAFAFAVGFFGLLGLADDLRGLSVITRLALQAAGAGGVATLLVMRLPWPAWAVVMAAGAGTAWLAGFVNAFNFMDGVNGISGAHALVGGVTYACLAGWRHDGFGVAAGLVLAAGAVAFLPWNAVRARVFLGDVGSYSIGAALAVLAFGLVMLGVPAEAAIGPVGHRTHVYQRWCDAGFSHPQVTLMTCALTVLLCLLGAAGVVGGPAARAAADVAGVGVLAVYLGSPGLFARAGLVGGA